jgi:DNA polymerase-3 subunit epsilon
MTQHLVIDCETSGLFDYSREADAPGQPRLCQIGMIWVDDDLATIREVEHVIRPAGWEIEPEATAINGFTQEMLQQDGIDIEGPLHDYASAIDDHHVIVGFNVPFDVKLMRGELRRFGLEDRYMKTRTLCVMQGCRRIVDARTKDGRSKAPKLEEACSHFAIGIEPFPHRALGGARAALEILRKLRELGQMPAYKDPYDKGLEPTRWPVLSRQK